MVSDDVVRLMIGVIGVGFVLYIWFGRVPPPRPAERARRRVLGRGPRLHLDHRVGRHAAVRDPCSAAAAGEDELVGTITIFFAVVNLMRIVPYFALGHLDLREPDDLGGAAAARDRVQFPRLLAGAARSDRVRSTASRYTLIFLISLAIMAQGVTGLLRTAGLYCLHEARCRDCVAGSA